MVVSSGSHIIVSTIAIAFFGVICTIMWKVKFDLFGMGSNKALRMTNFTLGHKANIALINLFFNRGGSKKIKMNKLELVVRSQPPFISVLGQLPFGM